MTAGIISIIISFIFSLYLNPRSVRRFLKRQEGRLQPEGRLQLEGASCDSPEARNDRLTAGAVMRRIRLTGSKKKFYSTIESFARLASAEGVQLLAFPEYNGIDLLGMLPCLRIIDGIINRRCGPPETGSDEGGEESASAIVELLLKSSSTHIERFLTGCCSLSAKKYGLYIYTGSYIFRDGDRYFNAGSLIGPDGRVIGLQKKMHLTDFERKIGLVAGDALSVFDLPFGRTAFPVCMDASYFEVFELALQKDAEIITVPIANMEEYSEWKARRGIWCRAQENCFYGIKPALNGRLAGMHFTGKAEIVAPVELTEEKNGFLSSSAGFEGDELITAVLDTGRLRKYRKNRECRCDSNPFFENEYAAETYSNLKIYKG